MKYEKDKPMKKDSKNEAHEWGYEHQKSSKEAVQKGDIHHKKEDHSKEDFNKKENNKK